MGYQDYDRFGRDRNYGGYRSGGGGGDAMNRGRDRSGRQERYGRDENRYWGDDDRYDRDERGFFDRAGDEVRSWFGDEEAERRRRQDEREYERERMARERDPNRDDSNRWRNRDDDDRWVGTAYADPTMGGGGFFRGSGADYGAGRGAGATSSWGLGAGKDRETWAHDPYRSWRERQMNEFDRDYDEYRREHQSKFESDFGTWREGRQKQRQSLRQVNPHQEVVGSDGQHIGTVDKVAGDRIILTKSDTDASGHHHSIPCSWITNVGERVEVNKTADEAHKAWRDEENRSAFLGEEHRRRDDGPHYLNRSFSGTY